MSLKYYIHADNLVTGPHDAASLMRKVRNGTLTSETLVSQTAESAPVAASVIKELKELIKHKDETATQEIYDTMTTQDSSKFMLLDLLKEGFEFWKFKIDISMWTAIFLIIVILLGAALAKLGLGPIAGFVAGIAVYACLAMLFSGILNLKRGKPVGIETFTGALKAGLVPILIFGALFSLPVLFFAISKILGMIMLFISLLILPKFILALFCYTDKKMSFKEGLQASNTLVAKGGIDMYALMLGLVVIGLLGVFIFGLGLMLTLPVVAVALSQVYEHSL